MPAADPAATSIDTPRRTRGRSRRIAASSRYRLRDRRSTPPDRRSRAVRLVSAPVAAPQVAVQQRGHRAIARKERIEQLAEHSPAIDVPARRRPSPRDPADAAERSSRGTSIHCSHQRVRLRRRADRVVASQPNRALRLAMLPGQLLAEQRFARCGATVEPSVDPFRAQTRKRGRRPVARSRPWHGTPPVRRSALQAGGLAQANASAERQASRS